MKNLLALRIFFTQSPWEPMEYLRKLVKIRHLPEIQARVKKVTGTGDLVCVVQVGMKAYRPGDILIIKPYEITILPEPVRTA